MALARKLAPACRLIPPRLAPSAEPRRAHADPTGETAARRLDRDRRLAARARRVEAFRARHQSPAS